MSTIDQAFIRAYQERLAKGTVMPAAQAVAPRSELENARHDDACAVHPQPIGRIDVAADAAIPPPHADFTKAEKATLQATAELPVTAFGQSPKAALSSFTETSSRSGSPAAFFKPALEVDAVCWPPICERLVQLFPDRFNSLGDEICREAHCKVVAVSGLRRNEGQTTLVLCLARCLAGRAKVAIIDGDFTNPCLAHQLGIGPEAGWETVLLGKQQLAEITIQSAADRIALVPLASAVESTEPAQLNYRVAVSLAELADHYDVVLVDAGPMSDESSVANRFVQPSSGVQGIILTHDVRRAEASRLAATCLDIAASNQNLLGIAETFAS